MLNLDNLSVWFGGGRDRVDAVRNASFCVNSGASFGIVGESGSGKSTILLAIEFALFGTSRSDLPGEILLRKGSSQSSVELTFVLKK